MGEKIKALYLFIFFFGFNSFGADLPKQFFSASFFAEQFRPGIITKLTQMNQNYVRTANGNRVFYTSPSESVTCGDSSTVSAGAPLFELSFQKTLVTNEYRESRIYKGCAGVSSFSELYRVKGVSAEVHSAKDIFEGNMDFDLTDRIDELTYQMKDHEGSPIFEIFFKRIGQKTSLIVKVDGNIALVRTVNRVGPKVYISYSPRAYSVSFSFNNYNIQVDNQKVTPALQAYMDQLNTFYYDSQRNRISMGDFQKKFNFGSFPSIIVKAFLSSLPPTEFVRTGTFNVKFLQELRQLQSFLISGTNGNLIRAKIEEYIKAAEEGSLVDNR